MSRPFNNIISDGTRSVAANTAALAAQALPFIEANNINDNAGLATAIDGITTVAGLRTLLKLVALGLIDVGPPNST